MGLVLCLASFVFVLRFSRHSLGRGLGALLAVGYLYGILRARFPDGFSHLVFDTGTLGLYLGRFWGDAPAEPVRHSREAKLWVTTLTAWPLLIFFVPYQDPLIQLVGLRAAVFFLPVILLGVRASESDLREVAGWLAGLNLLAFGFAVAEYQMGIELFYPVNAVTELIYRSFDIGPEGHPRIPATFVNAHAYAGTMVATLPFLFARWLMARIGSVERPFMACAIVASTLGVFAAGARQPAVILFLELLVVCVSRMSIRKQMGLLALGCLVAFFVWHSERLQRFTTLSDTEAVRERVGKSVNLGFLEMLGRYPFGAGLGSAVGTSIPSFLEVSADDQIGMESEYGRIALEQSALGLALWVAFVAWTLTRRPAVASPHWALGVQLMRVYVLCSWGAALIGTGTLTSIPSTVLLLLQMGIVAGGGLEGAAPATAFGAVGVRGRVYGRPAVQ
jgi:hypothetical protein